MAPIVIYKIHEIGPSLGRVLNKVIKEITRMANNFDQMTAAVDRVADEVRAVAEAIANPAVDNNNQAVIDELTDRLNAAADALGDATAAENLEDNPNPAPTEPVTDNGQPSEV